MSRRRWCVWTIGGATLLVVLGGTAWAARPAVERWWHTLRLKSADAVTARNAATILIRDESATDETRTQAAQQLLFDPHAEAAARLCAYERLAAAGKAVEVVPALADRSPAVRLFGAMVLRRIGRPAIAQIPALVALFADPDNDVRKEARFAVFEIAPETADLRLELRRALNEAEREARIDAVSFLAALEPPDLEGLRQASANSEALVRLRLAEVLRQIAPTHDAALAILTNLLADSEGPVREAAREQLGMLGSIARSSLLHVAQTAGPLEGRRLAAGLLNSLGDSETQATARRLWIEDLGTADEYARGFAVFQLKRAGTAALADLRRAHASTDVSIRHAAAIGLAEQDPNAMETLPTLIDALDHGAAHLRPTVAHCLAAMGARAKPAILSLRAAARSADPQLANAAQIALTSIAAQAACSVN